MTKLVRVKLGTCVDCLVRTAHSVLRFERYERYELPIRIILFLYDVRGVVLIGLSIAGIVGAEHAQR